LALEDKMVTLERPVWNIWLRTWRAFVLPLVGLLRDRRGVTALFFAVSATVLLGFVGLATEVGTWYLARVEAYNAADAAATAAALALAISPGDASAAENAATDIVLRNGFTLPAGNPPISPPVDGNYVGNAAATEVWVSVNFSPVLASLFTSQSRVTVTARAVGLLGSAGSACALAIAGGLTIAQAQNSNTVGVPCYYASNVMGATSDTTGNIGVTVSGAPPINAPGITSTKGCANCPIVPALTGGNDSSGQTYLGRPNASYQPPTTNPYTVIYDPATNIGLDVAVSTIRCPSEGVTFTYSPANPPLDANNCPPAGTTANVTTLVPAVPDTNNPSVNCGTLTAGELYCGYYNMNVVLPSSTITLFPAQSSDLTYAGGDSTYLFVNSSLRIPGGATLQCMVNLNKTNPPPTTPTVPCAPGPPNPNFTGTLGAYGVTFIFTGNNVGTFTIQPGASANLAAPAVNSFAGAPNGLLNGVLFYRRGMGSTENALSPGVGISDTTGGIAGGLLFNGIMYFPSSFVFYTGNTNAAYTPQCSILVAATLALGPVGDPGLVTQFSAGCSAYRSLQNAGTTADVPNIQAAQLVE
jgi:Flp pilus assembly protein TadG